MTTYDKLYIDGAWVPSTGKATIEVFDSTDGSVIATIPDGTADDVDKAARAARAAFADWAARDPEERGKFMSRIAEGLGGRMDEIATIVTREAGMPKWLSLIVQAGLPINSFGQAGALAGSYKYEEENGNSLIVREPVGVVGCITPWNYPLHQIAAKVAYAMAAGCTVVLKPSEVAPLDAFLLAEVINDAGLPAGVFNLVSGTGQVVGEAIASHPEIDMVSFTGSTRAGKRVAELASQSLKRVALELGGKSANILLDDLDDAGFDRAVRDGIQKAYLNSGQTCSALTRMLVPQGKLADAERIAAEEVESKYQPGDPFADGATLGPLSSQAQVERVNGYIQKGIDEGAKLVTGGPGKPEGLDQGYFVKPTVFSARVERHDDRAGGDLRAGPLDHPLRRRGRRRHASPTTATTASRAACGQATRSVRRRLLGASVPGRSRSTAVRSTRTLPSVATSSPATAASTASTASRSSSRSRRCSCNRRPDRRLARARLKDENSFSRIPRGQWQTGTPAVYFYAVVYRCCSLSLRGSNCGEAVGTSVTSTAHPELGRLRCYPTRVFCGATRADREGSRDEPRVPKVGWRTRLDLTRSGRLDAARFEISNAVVCAASSVAPPPSPSPGSRSHPRPSRPTTRSPSPRLPPISLPSSRTHPHPMRPRQPSRSPSLFRRADA